MLERKSIEFIFFDDNTGEVIQAKKLERFNNEPDYETQDFLSDKLLASYISSFKRGCEKRENLSLLLDFKIEKVF